jgi:hypothetical protein
MGAVGGNKRGTMSADSNSCVSDSDVDSLFTSQRKNIEGLMRASQVALDGAVAVWRHQLDFAESAAKRYSQLASDLAQKRGSANEQLASCVEYFKHDFETNLLNARTLLEISTKASRDSMQIVNERIDASLGEALRKHDKRNA